MMEERYFRCPCCYTVAKSSELELLKGQYHTCYGEGEFKNYVMQIAFSGFWKISKEDYNKILLAKAL